MGVAEHPCRDCLVRLGLAHSLMGSHGGADEEAVGGVGQQGLARRLVVGCAGKAGPDVEFGRPDGIRVVDLNTAAIRTSQPPASAGSRPDASSRRQCAAGRSACRMTSGSSATSNTIDRAQRLSPCLNVTVLLAIARPRCSGSTSMSSGSCGDPARAKTLCSVLTVLPSWPTSAATIDCASNWPPNTTGAPVSTLWAR